MPGLGSEVAASPQQRLSSRSASTSQPCRSRSRHPVVELCRGRSGVEERGSFFDSVEALRDDVVNHGIEDADPDRYARGQYGHRREIDRVAGESDTETRAALELRILRRAGTGILRRAGTGILRRAGAGILRDDKARCDSLSAVDDRQVGRMTRYSRSSH